MTEWPVVSLITPIYNSAETLQRTIDSIRQQTYPHIEHIVMDGGSTDGTLDILRANEASLTWYSERDHGQSDAINRGFARATGAYLNWINADDTLSPTAIADLVEVFCANPGTGMVYGRQNLVHKDGMIWRDDRNVAEGTLADLLRGHNFISQTPTLLTREAWTICGPLRLDLEYCMDFDLNIKIMRRYPIKFIPKTLGTEMVYAARKTESGGLVRFEEICQMVEGHGGGAGDTHFKIGYWHYTHDNLRGARHHFRLALTRGTSPWLYSQLPALIVKTYLGIHVIKAGRAVRTSAKPRN